MKIKNRCMMCGKKAKRRGITYLYRTYTDKWWLNALPRFARKWFWFKRIQFEPFCKKCYLINNYGIYTIECNNCKDIFYINDDMMYSDKNIFCPYCGSGNLIVE